MKVACAPVWYLPRNAVPDSPALPDVVAVVEGEVVDDPLEVVGGVVVVLVPVDDELLHALASAPAITSTPSPVIARRVRGPIVDNFMRHLRRSSPIHGRLWHGSIQLPGDQMLLEAKR